MKRLLLAILAVLVLAPAARAELWAPLEDFVGKCVVIVKAKAVGESGDWRELAVVEVWIGSRDAIQLNDRGNYMSLKGEAGVNVETGQEIVIFFARDSERGGKLTRHGAAFPIVDGKLVYASTSDDYRAEYTVADFKRTVIEIARAKATPP
jgi:hypothetical protein